MIQTEFPDYDPAIAAEYAAQAGESLMDTPFFEPTSVIALLVRFTLNMLVCWSIIKYFYYAKSRRRDYYFTFMLFSLTIFLLIFLLDNIKIQMGFALGLFAIFGMIRYRTETVPIREMTYLFVIIGISVINGLAMTVSHAELIITNLLFIGGIWLMESNKFLKHVSAKIILYDNIKLITPDKYDELLADLKKRTGLEITKLEIGHIDFLRDAAYIKIYYQPNSQDVNTIDDMTKIDRENHINAC